MDKLYYVQLGQITGSAHLYRIIEAGFVQVQPSWGNVTITIAGLTNTYSSYVTTFEEYQAQRYEGASTIFGPHTLDAYIQVPSPPTRCAPAPAPLLPPPPLLRPLSTVSSSFVLCF